jgi:hypothetical protein
MCKELSRSAIIADSLNLLKGGKEMNTCRISKKWIRTLTSEGLDTPQKICAICYNRNRESGGCKHPQFQPKHRWYDKAWEIRGLDEEGVLF